jgi:citrate synthase
VLSPLAKFLITDNKKYQQLYDVAQGIEKTIMASSLSKDKKIFPNVDFYSGLVYSCLGLDDELFTPLFAASRVAGWTARVFEYIQNNRIFRPRALYVGEFNKKYVAVDQRD